MANICSNCQKPVGLLENYGDEHKPLCFECGKEFEKTRSNVMLVENMLPANWYYLIGEKQNGPVNNKEVLSLVKSHLIKPDTFVWKDGLAEWIPAGKSAFSSFFKGLQPPPITKVAIPIPIPKDIFKKRFHK